MLRDLYKFSFKPPPVFRMEKFWAMETCALRKVCGWLGSRCFRIRKEPRLPMTGNFFLVLYLSISLVTVLDKVL
jgi:hypothetical protein